MTAQSLPPELACAAATIQESLVPASRETR
jgi:hypothetical protein